MKSPKSAGKSEYLRSFVSLPALAVLLVVAIAGPARASQPQFLSGHIPTAIKRFHLRPVGRLPSGQRLSVVIGLPIRNQAGFQEVLDRIYNPASPEYHHYLTPSQISDRFGPTPADYNAIVTFAKTNGLRILHAHKGRNFLTVEGTVADIEKAFHVKMLVYPHPIEVRTFYAPDAEPSVDLNVSLLHISGLDNFFLPRPGGHPENGLVRTGAMPGAGSGPGGAFWGKDFRNAYVPGTSLAGTGQSVGLLELDGYYTNDIVSYESAAGLPNVVITNVLVDGATGTPDGFSDNVGEVSLDMEMVIAMAPGISRLIVYEAPNSGTTWVDILAQMQEDDSAKQLSSSWLVFDDPNADTVYQEFAMQGQSFFQCSGDDLAFYDGVGQWADDPYITVVGGTTLTNKNGSWSSEAVWNNGDGQNGSGGGVSSPSMGNYSIPSWQQGINMAANGGSTSNRNVPDVALFAYNAYVYWDDGQAGGWWGTSIAAPLWAGFAALANQQATARSEPSLGFLNPALYAIGTSSLYASCFHDITSGNNTNGASSNLYFAVPGYDLCTGWGTPYGPGLINTLTQSPYIYDTIRNTNGNVTLFSLCLPGSTNFVASATNLAPPIVWKTISTNIAGATGNLQFTDTNAPHYKKRFYRIISP